MVNWLKRIFAVIALLLTVGTVAAKNVDFKIEAPSKVAAGKAFRIEYSSNVKPEKFIPPQFDGIDVLAGPSTSTQQGISIVNGNMVQESKHSYIYAVVIAEAGVIQLPPAKIVVDGKEYSSGRLPIEIVDEGSSTDSGAQQGGQQGATTDISADDIFLRTIVDKTSVYKGEAVRVTMKVYTRVPIAGYSDAKFPAFNGFWKQQLNTDHYKEQRETYKSKVYNTRILTEYLLFPQQTGTLQIEQAEFTAVVQQMTQRRSQSIFDDFFGGGPDVIETEQKIRTAPINIRVNNLPDGAPSSFNGAVGNFTMSSDFPEEPLSANSSADYVIKISGTGNLPLLQAPVIEVPTSFEQYNVKSTESINRVSSGISGYKQFEYPLIARAAGDFVLEPVVFTYFNPESARYVTLNTSQRNVRVLPDSTGGGSTSGLVSGFSKEDVKILGQDIRFVKLGSPNLKQSSVLFMGSIGYWLIFVLIIALFTFLLIYLQKRMELMKNVAFVRGRRANKVALQRLKKAQSYMSSDEQRSFYEEMLKALWGYMSDKLNIPVATLTRESVREELTKREVPKEQINRYIDLISDSEYSQYSPGESRQMKDVYATAVESISKLESLIKR